MASTVDQTKRVVDEDLAIKPINPLIDNALGFAFIILVLRLLYEFKTNLNLGLAFFACLVGVVVCSKIVSRVAVFVGKFISEYRTSSSIPMDCRNPLKSKLAMRKFSDQAWQLVIHLSMALFEIWLLQGTTWWENPASTFQPCPVTFVDGTNKHPFLLQFYYILQLAIWVWTGFSCKWLEARRKDYLEMMLHHIMTIMLVLASLISQELGIGLVVLVVHDVSDVFLDLMKMVNYLKIEDWHGFFFTEICFVVNLISWVYFRLYKFPISIIHQGVYLGYGQQCGVSGEGEFANCQSVGSCLPSTFLLSGLFCLHIFWFFLILRIAFRLLTGQKSSHAAKAEYEGLSGSDCNTNKRD